MKRITMEHKSEKQKHEKRQGLSPETLQPEHTRIGFKINSDRLQISHDLQCSLDKSEVGMQKSEYFSDEVLVTATLESVSLARGIG